VTLDLRRADDHEDVSRRAATLIAERIRQRPDARVLVATGRTPMRAYGLLGEMVRQGRLDASGITVFQLDEYLDLAPDDERSLGRWALETFVRPLGIADDRFIRLPLDGALDAYDERVRADGGYDLSILGIGENGHLGFNEPPSSPSSPSRIVELTDSTIQANTRYWGDAGVPRRAATVGLGTLLDSRSVLLLASGRRKRDVLERSLFGPVTAEVPASCLQLAQGEVVVIADAAAFPATKDATP
jgi:glucosamine-6-phosphate deaminase